MAEVSPKGHSRSILPTDCDQKAKAEDMRILVCSNLTIWNRSSKGSQRVRVQERDLAAGAATPKARMASNSSATTAAALSISSHAAHSSALGSTLDTSTLTIPGKVHHGLHGFQLLKKLRNRHSATVRWLGLRQNPHTSVSHTQVMLPQPHTHTW